MEKTGEKQSETIENRLRFAIFNGFSMASEGVSSLKPDELRSLDSGEVVLVKGVAVSGCAAFLLRLLAGPGGHRGLQSFDSTALGSPVEVEELQKWLFWSRFQVHYLL